MKQQRLQLLLTGNLQGLFYRGKICRHAKAAASYVQFMTTRFCHICTTCPGKRRKTKTPNLTIMRDKTNESFPISLFNGIRQNLPIVSKTGFEMHLQKEKIKIPGKQHHH